MAKQHSDQTIREYNQAFLEALELLNPAQQTAVNQIEGPVLVIAGPGTGKTHILAARIGRILIETDTFPQNILCLTFTDAGVHAMRQRLLSFIGPEAHRVHIYTFHSFCNSVIQENLEFFGRHDMEPISDLEQIELFRNLIDSLEYDHPIKGQRNDPYAFERRVKSLMLQMKSENWSVDFILKKIDAYLEDLPTREDYIYKRKTKEFAAGDIKQWKIDEEARKMKRLKAAVNLYPEYIRLMRKMRRYDYSDMVLWVVKAFKENEALLRTYQERYLYFLVDEFQDTNGSQNEIIQSLINYWEKPNVFIVGDDDQSIFEFQGARLQNLLDFHQEHEDLKMVVLKDNYRSTQTILDFSKKLIDQNEHRIVNKIAGLEKTLEAKRATLNPNPLSPSIIEYPNRTQEIVDLVFQLEQLQAQGVSLDEVAIIYAQHRQVANLLSLLDKKGIPYNTKRAVNILDLPNTRKLIQLLDYISKEQTKPFSGEPDLFKLMHFDFLNLPLDDLGRLSLYMAKHQYQHKLYWRSVISDPILLAKIDIQHPDAFQAFSKLTNDLIRGSANLSILKLIEQVINRSGLLVHVMNQSDKSWQLQALNTFFEFIKKEGDKNPRLTLAQLLDTFKSMDANRLAIGIQKSIVANQGVNLVTAHSSKGLEFEYVFIIDAVKDFWEAKRKGSNQFSYPDTLTLSGEKDAIEARRRLFYVAMTRAKSSLNISYSSSRLDGKKLTRAIFVDEVLSETSSIDTRNTPEDLILESQLLQLQTVDHPKIPAQEKALVEALLEGFALSVSSLNRFLKCPLSFYYEDVLKIPSVQSEAATFGIAMHDALRRLFDKMRLSKTKQFPGLKEFLIFFEEEMNRLRAYFNETEFDRRVKLGKNHLSNYYKNNLTTWARTVFTEYNIKNIELDGVPLVGTVDRIDLLETDKAHIVDYKTGSTDKRKLQKPSERDPLGGLYWRQLVFYKILFELHQPTRKAISAEISYLEPNKKGEYISNAIDFPIEEVEQVKEMVRSTYKKIKAHDFYEGCGEETCSWCSFVKLNATTVSFSDRDGELLDD